MIRAFAVIMIAIALTGCSAPQMQATKNPSTTELTSTQTTIPTIKIEELDEIIFIDYIGVSKPNSVGGVDWRVKFDNKADIDIKYITFTVQAYNAVDDPVLDEITNRSIKRCKLTGPVAAGKADVKVVWDTIWYNKTIDVSKLLKIEIEYMSGETITIDQTILDQIDYTNFHD